MKIPMLSDEEIWLVKDKQALSSIPPGDERVTFFPGEIDLLRGKTPEEIRAVYLVKQEFSGARVVPSGKRNG